MAEALRITVSDITLGAETLGTTVTLEGGRTAEIIALPGNTYRIFLENQVLTGYVVAHDYAAKTFTLSAGGYLFDCKAQTRLDQLLDKFGFGAGTAAKVSNLKAPMPGQVLRILVEPGQVVEKGTPLLVLVAMKMENMIKAQGPATVTKILVAENDNVEKGHVLIAF